MPVLIKGENIWGPFIKEAMHVKFCIVVCDKSNLFDAGGFHPLMHYA